MAKQNQVLLAFVIGAIVVFAAVFMLGGKSLFSTTENGAGVPTSSGSTVTQCAQNPAYTYSAVDAYASGTTVGGTDQIKANGNAPVTSLASPTAGDSLQYWKSNTTYICDIKSSTVACGSNSVQTKCYQNASVTVSFADVSGSVATAVNAGGSANLTIDANDVANLEMTYTGVSKKSLMPLGGCVAVEYPTGISVDIKGAGLDSSVACPYVWDYQVSSTSNSYRTFAVPAGFDTSMIATPKKVSMQLSSGSANPAGTMALTFQAANYYVTDAGEFALGIQKDKNQDTTKVGSAVSSSVIIS